MLKVVITITSAMKKSRFVITFVAYLEYLVTANFFEITRPRLGQIVSKLH